MPNGSYFIFYTLRRTGELPAMQAQRSEQVSPLPQRQEAQVPLAQDLRVACLEAWHQEVLTAQG